MKTLITLISAALISIAAAETVSLPLAGKGKGGQIPSGLKVSASVAGQKVVIILTDGKRKFGSADISMTKGDVIYTRPRLKLVIPLDKAKAVTADAPLLVTPFKHKEAAYEITLVKGSGELPDVVFTSK